MDDKGVWCGLNTKNNGFDSGKYWSNNANVEHALRFIDINQDKLADLCWFDDSGVQCQNNTGNEFDAQYQHSTLIFDLELSEEKDSKLPQPQWIDVNGDAQPDLCGFIQGQYQCALSYQPSAKAFNYHSPSVWINDLNISNYNQGKLAQFNRSFRQADLNNDGLIDICYKDEADFNCHINIGTSYQDAKSWLTLPAELNQTTGRFIATYEHSIALVDENQDGRVDLCAVIAHQRICVYNNGSGFDNSRVVINLNVDINELDRRQSIYTRPIKKLFGLKTTFHTISLSSAYGPFKLVADLNNDGWSDYCYRSFTGLSCGYKRQNPLALLSQITNSFGLKTQIEYGKLNNNNYVQSTSTHPVISTTPAMDAVSKIITDTTTGQQNSLSYDYKGYRYHLEDGSLGFEQISSTHDQKNIMTTTTYEQNNQDLLGTIVKVQTRVDGQLNYQKNNTYETIHHYPNTNSAHLLSTTEKFYTNNILTKQINSTYQNYNQYD